MSPRSRSWRFPRAQATTLPTSTTRGICKESSPRFRGQKMFMGESRNKSDERKPGVALTQYARPHPGPFVPQAFTQEEFAVVRRLVEIILGEDLKNASERLAPGAPASIYDEVAEWIDLVVTSAPGTRTVALNLPADQRALAIAYFGSEEPVRYLESFEPESVCREGLAWLGEESQRRIAKGFLDVDAGGQAELVRAISDARPDRSATHAGTRLFDFLKEETIRACYTSRMGLKELDDHGNSFYGQPPGCGLPLRLRPTRSEPE